MQSTTVLLAVVAGLSLADYCPPAINNQIQTCVHPVGEYAKMLNQNQSGMSIALPKMGATVFKDLCKLVETFNECVKDLRRTCPRHVTIGLIDSSYGYLCHDGYNAFHASAECLMELDRKPEVKTCHDQTLKDIELANSNPEIGLNEKVDKMCNALNFFSGCVKHPIRAGCGVMAWQVIHRVLKDTTKTLMPGCAFGRPTTTMASAVIDNGVEEQDNKEPPPHSSHHHHSESRHSEIRSHGTRAGRRKVSTTTTEATSTGSDFFVESADDISVKSYVADSKIVPHDMPLDYYSVSNPLSSSSISSTFLFLIAVVALRLR